MKILITNDDSISGEGLSVLANWAKTIGEVTVVAPENQQSGKSHAIEIHSPFAVKMVEYLPGVTAYTVDSTPADCVRFAYDKIGSDFDLVLSGINRGFNLGEDIAYSGTCGAVFEAAYRGACSIAFSTDPDSFAVAEKHIDGIYRFITENRLFDLNPIYNVNIPLNAREIKITRQGGAYFRDTYIEKEPGIYIANGYSAYEETGDLTLDTEATFGGYISVTPLTNNRTAEGAYAKLSRL